MSGLYPPSLDDFSTMAQAAFRALPAAFRAQCEGLEIRVADFAQEDTLHAMDITDPFELTGLYHGVALTEKSVMDTGGAADQVWLYRRPILDEWVERGDIALDALIAHVLVHEIAHHFGFSDDDIDRIEAEAG